MMEKSIKLKLLPVGRTLEENRQFAENPDCMESLQMSVNFYGKVGYFPPWIGYYVQIGEKIVGAAGFKGKPENGKVEIAYATFEPFRNQGIGTRICQELVRLAHDTDPDVKVTARTLPEKNFSTRILEKNRFQLLGTVIDAEDGPVFEWLLIR
jgi:RimJ/RimL family protein N-acetyltransferase